MIVGVALAQWLLKEYISELKDCAILLLAFIVVDKSQSNAVKRHCKIHYMYLKHTVNTYKTKLYIHTAGS